jgi:hypothetical protein
MTGFLRTQWRLGIFLVLTVAGLGCSSRSNAATTTPPANKPPPMEGGETSLPIGPEQPITKAEGYDRGLLLAMLKSRTVPLLHSGDTMLEEAQAKAALTRTFERGGWLSKELFNKIQVTEPECALNGCSVQVTYSDWKTFVTLDQKVFRQPESPFMSFPGARYRTGRVLSKDKKMVASWILAFRLRAPDENQGSNRQEVQ